MDLKTLEHNKAKCRLAEWLAWCLWVVSMGVQTENRLRLGKLFTLCCEHTVGVNVSVFVQFVV